MIRALVLAVLALSPALGAESAAPRLGVPSGVALPALPALPATAISQALPASAALPPLLPSAKAIPNSVGDGASLARSLPLADALPQAQAAVSSANPADAPQAGAVFDGSAPPPQEPGEDLYPKLTPRQYLRQLRERVLIQTQRALTMPVHAWPFSKVAQKLAHGEAFAGLRPVTATQAAEEIRATHGVGAVVGRLSWELRDVWSVKGAYRSYSNLIDEIIKSKKKDPRLDIALSLDVESLGGQLLGLSIEQRRKIAKENIERLARRADAAGIPVELDIGASAVMPILLDVAHDLVRSMRIPVRLALSARYEASVPAVRAWADLARETGLKLGVRLIKGSFIEGDRPGTINLRRDLIEHYKKLVTEALERHDQLDVAVATHSLDIYAHAKAEAKRLNARFSINSIRGINPEAQAHFRAAGDLSREYLSFGVDTPVMALMETWTNWRQKRAMRKRGIKGEID